MPILPMKQHSGSSLTEVMVAVAIFSLGLLGLEAVQLQNQYQLQETLLRGDIAHTTADLAEAMRANPDGAAYQADPATSCLPCQDCERTTQEQARQDLACFQQALQQRLGQIPHRARVCNVADPAPSTLESPPCQGSGSLSVSIVWQRSHDQAPSAYLVRLGP